MSQPVWDGTGVPPTQTASAGFDPGKHTVSEVQDYLAAHPEQTDSVLNRERAGKARTSLIGA